MIQDIGEHTFDNQYHPCPPDRESYALYYEDHAALVRKYPDRIEFPKFRDIERLNEMQCICSVLTENGIIL